MSEYIKEKSCGAVVYRLNKKGHLQFLLIKQNKGHYGFPKGHVEGNETEYETAIREVKEETNVEIEIHNSFRIVSTYSPTKGVLKDVIFFLATPKTMHLIAQPEEVEVVMWAGYFKAKMLLNHKQNKYILKQALIYIKEHKLTEQE